MSALPAPKAPPIVGRPVLLEYAAIEFLHEVTRQKPWRRARYEALLMALDEFLGAPAPLAAYTSRAARAWQRQLPPPAQEDAAELLSDFETYLSDWGWLESARSSAVWP
ncbi:hypothetical protein [Deinococcus sp. YIM 77859]|uniref:hypothetical protein n=1 Tax=Deinococcus sp. YIM 77859 TaxID=1540221 RepID=UPI00068987F3|nr:hypothetical protein [Deinococcus sp. YIM 77859]